MNYIIIFQVEDKSKQEAIVDDIRRWLNNWAKITDNCYVVSTSLYNAETIRNKLVVCIIN